jgi:hypothetical protein
MGQTLTVGKVIKMPCMRSGLCKYDKETILVTKESLQNMAPTIQGVPVVIEHPEEKITTENIDRLRVVGRVADMHYDDSSETWYAHFVIEDDEAVKLLQQGYGVSTAWIGQKYASGGTFNNCPYDKEVIEAKYEHLAIVKNPRYEMAFNPIFCNSKDRHNNDNIDNIINVEKKESISMIGKLFKKIIQKEEVMVNSNEEYTVEVDGKELPLKEAIEQIKLNAKEEAKCNEVDVDGEKMSVNELVDAYKNLKKASLEKEEEDKKRENEAEEEKKKEEEAKKNAENEEEETKKEEEKEEKAKKNSRFNELDELHKNGKAIDQVEFLSVHERVELGKSKYGSKK